MSISLHNHKLNKMRTIGIILTTMLLFSACNKDDVLDLLPEMSATIDGEKWTSVTRVTVEQEEKFVITGTSASGEVLIITVCSSGQLSGGWKKTDLIHEK